MTKQEQWEATRDFIRERDNNSCRFFSNLKEEYQQYIIKNSNGLYKILDSAHIFGKGAFPHLYYETKNIVLLNRYSHSMIDTGKHPVFGTPISKEDSENFWKSLIGEELYNLLYIAAYQVKTLKQVQSEVLNG